MPGAAIDPEQEPIPDPAAAAGADPAGTALRTCPWGEKPHGSGENGTIGAQSEGKKWDIREETGEFGENPGKNGKLGGKTRGNGKF